MLSTYSEMICLNTPLFSLKNQLFHSIGDNLWLTVPSLATIQFPKHTGFDKENLGVAVFLNNLLVI